MKTIKDILWCFAKKNGISLIEPNSNLANGHIEMAEEAMREMQKTDSRRWKIIESYYAIYEAFYAVLTRIGIKCEIHDGTIGIVQVFLNNQFSKEEGDFFEKAFQARKDVQYYVNREVKDEFYREMLDNTPKLIAKAKRILSTLTDKEINEIRDTIKKYCK